MDGIITQQTNSVKNAIHCAKHALLLLTTRVLVAQSWMEIYMSPEDAFAILLDTIMSPLMNNAIDAIFYVLDAKIVATTHVLNALGMGQS